MKQCELRRGTKVSSRVYVVWLPEKFAVVGKLVDLKIDSDTWSKEWEVKKVYGPRLPEEYVREHSRDWTRTRQASDI